MRLKFPSNNYNEYFLKFSFRIHTTIIWTELHLFESNFSQYPIKRVADPPNFDFFNFRKIVEDRMMKEC